MITNKYDQVQIKIDTAHWKNTPESYKYPIIPDQ